MALIIEAVVVVLSLLSFQLALATDFQLEPGYQLLDVPPFMHDDEINISPHKLVDGLAGLEQWSRSVQDEAGASLVLRVMHRDSPFSPFRKPGATRLELMRERLRRDAVRVQALTRRVQLAAEGVTDGDSHVEKRSGTNERGATLDDFNSPIVSGISQGSGEYFTRLGIGTPARNYFMVLDTGSDILWIQCAPCADCYTQTDPIFNPASSSSFHSVPCSSPMCTGLQRHVCHPRTGACVYEVAYGDGSFTVGDFSLETLSFKEAILRNVALGCGHDNEGLFVGAAGLLGLGGGALSFPSQIGAQFDWKFSYCLVERDRGGSSNIIFGNSAVPPGTVFTPLLKNPKLDTFYYVSLTGISVGGIQLSIPASAFNLDGSGNGGVIVDSGTVVTRLVESAYGPLRSAFRAATSHLPFAGSFSILDTCYDLAGLTKVRVPTVVLHFGNAADVALPARNFLVAVDNSGTFCLAFASTAGALSIIGNIQQQGFRVVFDGQNARMGFAANQCT